MTHNFPHASRVSCSELLGGQFLAARLTAATGTNPPLVGPSPPPRSLYPMQVRNDVAPHRCQVFVWRVVSGTLTIWDGRVRWQLEDASADCCLSPPDPTSNLAHAHGARCFHTSLIEVGICALQYIWLSAVDKRAHVACEALVPERNVTKRVLGGPIVYAKGLRVFNLSDGGDDPLHSLIELLEEL